jgi:hypothetical protein
MRVQKRNPWLYSLGMVLAAMALWGTRAGADVTSDRPGSIVIWPKVIADGTRDTIISLTNTRNEMAYAHCVYVNGLGTCSLSGALCTLPSESAAPDAPACPGGTSDICQLQCQPGDFDIQLTRQQPTFWRVSTGRVDNPLGGSGTSCTGLPGTPPRQSCPGYFQSGQVLPPVQPFRGELRCIQTSSDGSPLAANGLKGEATIETLGTTQISEYNSINVRAAQPPSDTSLLELNGVDPANDAFNVYNACPQAEEFTHYAVGSEDLVASTIDPTACATTGCPVTTETTVIPCRADYENGIPTRFGIHVEYTNEFEQTLTIDRAFQCWTTFTLENLGFTNVAGSTFQRTRLNPSGSGLCIAGDADRVNQPCANDAACGTNGVCAPAPGILAVFEEFHDSDANIGSEFDVSGTAAGNAFSVDTDRDGFFAKPGRCRGNLSQTCTSDATCLATGSHNGVCRTTSNTCTSDSDCTGDGNFCDLCMNDEIRLQPDLVTNPVP